LGLLGLLLWAWNQIGSTGYRVVSIPSIDCSMEAPFKNLHFPLTHWQRKANEEGGLLPLRAFGFLNSKEGWVRAAFDTVNFSLILRGGGSYLRGSVRHRVEAPCVIVQLPGEYQEYGPEDPHKGWTELYLVYHRKLVSPLVKSGLLPISCPVWKMENPAAVRAQLEELADCANAGDTAARIDRIAERIVFESRYRPAPAPQDHNTLRDILEEIQRDWRTPPDLTRLAEAHGLSVSTLKRRWASVVGVPPARYAMGLRIREAARLLAQTAEPISRIAHECGFDDEFYFTKAFRRVHGMPPRDYRKAVRKHQPPVPVRQEGESTQHSHGNSLLPP